jgi:hypothetical protein
VADVSWVQVPCTTIFEGLRAIGPYTLTVFMFMVTRPYTLMNIAKFYIEKTSDVH